jgi:beta-alanine--pyruvate transaminase
MVPAGTVLCKGKIYETLMDATPDDGSPTIELFHGYTYSCHPVAMAAGLATLDYYRDHQRPHNLEEKTLLYYVMELHLLPRMWDAFMTKTE